MALKTDIRKAVTSNTKYKVSRVSVDATNLRSSFNEQWDLMDIVVWIRKE